MLNWLFVFGFVINLTCIECKILGKDLITDEKEAITYLENANKRIGEQFNLLTIAQWNYATNISDQTINEQTIATEKYNAFRKNEAIEAKKYDWSDFNETNQRQFEKIAVIKTSALSGDDEATYLNVTNEMETIYSSATVCVTGVGCDLELDPDLSELMANSNDYEKLTEAWINWREASGKKMRDLYITYYTLGNKAATLNDIPNESFKTLDELWLFDWETPQMKDITENLWTKLRPYYEKLHAYVRIKLENQYPGRLPKDGTIPAQLLGNMWAQSWSNIMNITGVDPYPDVSPIDVTPALVNQGYDAKQMFHLSDKFFGDLGLDRMTDIFWNKSVIVKPDNITMVCHASAWDFYAKDDFRIKQCTKINMEDLITVHHEMGHIEYFQQYQNQPVVYREGANPGFHEAIGDLLALSVSTPKHLEDLKLLNTTGMNMTKINLKYQLKMAMDKLAFLPFGYIMDKWRWDVFSGAVSSANMNRHWWRLRIQYQGLSPPVNRSEADFDPGAKYHIPASVEYIRYFASHILQFQFHKALCDIAQPGVALYECDINANEEAGKRLKEMLRLGSSEKWPKQLEQLTGSKEMDVQPLIDYFQPLWHFLDTELEGQTVGWNANVNDYFTDEEITDSTTIQPTTIQPTTIEPSTDEPSSYYNSRYLNLLAIILCIASMFLNISNIK